MKKTIFKFVLGVSSLMFSCYLYTQTQNTIGPEGEPQFQTNKNGSDILNGIIEFSDIKVTN